jgi:hypothetical protein
MGKPARFRPYDTQWLTRACFEPAAEGRRLLAWGSLATVLVLIGTLLFLLRSDLIDPDPFATPHLAEAQREVTRLGAALDRVNAELGLERATRMELQRNADQLGARIAELNQQLEFLNSRQAAGPNNRPAH